MLKCFFSHARAYLSLNCCKKPNVWYHKDFFFSLFLFLTEASAGFLAIASPPTAIVPYSLIFRSPHSSVVIFFFIKRLSSSWFIDPALYAYRNMYSTNLGGLFYQWLKTRAWSMLAICNLTQKICFYLLFFLEACFDSASEVQIYIYIYIFWSLTFFYRWLILHPH